MESQYCNCTKKNEVTVLGGGGKKRNAEGWIIVLPGSGLRVSAVYLCLLLVQSLQTTTMSLSPQKEQGRQTRDEEPGGGGQGGRGR